MSNPVSGLVFVFKLVTYILIKKAHSVVAKLVHKIPSLSGGCVGMGVEGRESWSVYS